MDDGTCKSYKSKNRTYRFATHSFPFEDQEILVKALRGHFYGLMAATIQKHYSCYILYIRSKSTERFLDLISPFINQCGFATLVSTIKFSNFVFNIYDVDSSQPGAAEGTKGRTVRPLKRYVS